MIELSSPRRLITSAAVAIVALGAVGHLLTHHTRRGFTSEAMPHDLTLPATAPLAGSSITPITSVSDGAAGLLFSGDSYDINCTTTAAASVLMPAVHDGVGWTVYTQYPCTNTGSPTKISCVFPAKRGTGYTWNVYKTGAATLSSCTVEQRHNGAPFPTPPSSATVSSVAMSVPSIMGIAGSPVTSSGTLAVSLANQSANTVFAGPTSGGAAAPTFRALVASDLPALPIGTIAGGQTNTDAFGAASTVYLGPVGSTTFLGTRVALGAATRTGTLGRLVVIIRTAPGGADTVIATAQTSSDQGATWGDTSLTCTITGSAKTCEDVTHTPAVSQYDWVTFKLVSSAGTAAGPTTAALEVN